MLWFDSSVSIQNLLFYVEVWTLSQNYVSYFLPGAILHIFFRLEPHIAASDSTGSISIHRLASSKLEKTHSWKAHDYEAWITAFNQWDQEIVFTGEYWFLVWGYKNQKWMLHPNKGMGPFLCTDQSVFPEGLALYSELDSLVRSRILQVFIYCYIY